MASIIINTNKDAITLLKEVDDILKLSTNGDEKAFPLLLKYYQHIELLSMITQLQYNCELGRWYSMNKKYGKAIDYYKNVLVRFSGISCSLKGKLIYNSLKGICICSFHINNITEHEHYYKDLIDHVKTAFTGHLKRILIECCIWISEDYEKWVIENKSIAVYYITFRKSIMNGEKIPFTLISKFPMSTEFIMSKKTKTEKESHLSILRKHAKVTKVIHILGERVLENVDLDDSKVASKELYILGEKYLKNNDIKKALETFLLFLNNKNLFIVTEGVYQYILICYYLSSNDKNVVSIYNKYTNFMGKDFDKKWVDKYPKGALNGYSEGVPKGFKEWMIKVCPKFALHCGIKENILTLSILDIEQKNKEKELIKNRLLKEEEVRNQPTIIVNKKELNEKKKKKRSKNKKKKQSKVLETPETKSSVFLTSMKPTESKKISKVFQRNAQWVPRKDDELIPIVPLNVPIPLTRKEKKIPKPAKKISLAEWNETT